MNGQQNKRCILWCGALAIAILLRCDAALAQAPVKQVPVLCYHHIKKDIVMTTTYTVSAKDFYEQMKYLHDNGYQSILPDQLYDYLSGAGSLPPKPVMLTFDDAHAEHFSIVAPVLAEFNFRGVFFIMTVPIGKTGFVTEEQIKMLADSGHVIGNHTWDHQSVKALKGVAWDWQVSKPRDQLQRITGKAVAYFCYPYGEWTEEAIRELKKRDVKAAFQLGGKGSKKYPLYTIRRKLVAGSSTLPQFAAMLER
jgi:peptidoglycan/xylan/chitin deacetylase (PgdA/CDA1 family)